jgi:putative sigma-54 modulation protein
LKATPDYDSAPRSTLEIALFHCLGAADEIEKESAMNLTLTGQHLEITSAIRDYVTSKMSRLGRHFDHAIDVNVIMTVQKLSQKIEANVHIRGRDIFAECQDGDLYAAIDMLVDKLDRQVLKHKELFSKGRHNGALKHQTTQ